MIQVASSKKARGALDCQPRFAHVGSDFCRVINVCPNSLYQVLGTLYFPALLMRRKTPWIQLLPKYPSPIPIPRPITKIKIKSFSFGLLLC
jgi:hypothetical protein